MLYLAYIYYQVLKAVGNTLTEEHWTSRTKPVKRICMCRRKLTFTAMFLVSVRLRDNFGAFFNPKSASESNTISNTPPYFVQLERRTYKVSCHRMLLDIELRRQCQPLVYRPVHASNGAPRSVKHERRNLVTRVRGRRMTKVQERLHDKAYFLVTCW